MSLSHSRIRLAYPWFWRPLGITLARTFFSTGKMAPVADPSGGARADGGAEKESAVFRSRNYQLEMLEASMKENIIIAVGTLLSMSGRKMTVLIVL